MTHNEAIEQLLKLEEVIGGSNEFVLPTLLALAMAGEALEKQIPKKVISEGYGLIDLCPTCYYHLDIPEHINYCFECGQRLDWSEEE